MAGTPRQRIPGTVPIRPGGRRIPSAGAGFRLAGTVPAACQQHGCDNQCAVSTSDTKALIELAVKRFGDEVPALRQLKLVLRLELRARGDVPVWRVELPGPKVSKDPGGDARVDISVARSHFNELAKDGKLRHWVEAYEHGDVKVSGEPGVLKLVGNVILRQMAQGQRMR